MSAFREAPVPSVDAVRSIRIAHTLIERYLVLARTQPQSSAQMELVIGEAQQVYPEIWRHLDVARRALVADGRDVSGFDGYRRSELVELGVTDVDFSRELDVAALMLGRIRERTVKSATFNVGGAQRAAAAMNALMAVMPEVDFAALARAEEKEIRAAGSLHAGKWLGIVKWLAAGAAVLGVAILIHRIATAPSEEPPAPRREVAIKPPPPPDVVQDRIDELRRIYEASCDPQIKQSLLTALRDAHQTGTAQIIEKERCTPPHLPCDRAAIGQRYGTQDLVCESIVAPQPALFVLAAGKRVLLTNPMPATHRPWNPVELIPAAPAPLPMFVGFGDFDDDGIEEVVTADDTHLMVTRIRDGAFVDIPGPTLKAGCSALPNIEGDFRNGNTGQRKTLVLTVDDPHPKKGCPTTGRHVYVLTGDTLVESP